MLKIDRKFVKQLAKAMILTVMLTAYLSKISPVNAETATCLNWKCYDVPSERYIYDFHKCSCEPGGCEHTVEEKKFIVMQNTAVVGYWDRRCDSVPDNCNIGPAGKNICEPLGKLCGVYGHSGPACPPAYWQYDCHLIACAYRPSCCGITNCDCDDKCKLEGENCVEVEGGGFQPTSTPTPTPTPFCELFCPGTNIYDTNGQDKSGYIAGEEEKIGKEKYFFPVVTGYIKYFGYNGFACGSFFNGKDTENKYRCPASNPGFEEQGQAGGGGTAEQGQAGEGSTPFGLTSSWTYPVTPSPAIKYHMLCGQTPWVYTAQVIKETNDGQQEGVPGQEPLPTLIPTSADPGYPPGCVPTSSAGGQKPTPPERPGQANDVPAGGGDSGLPGASSGASSCSCSVTLYCPTSENPNKNPEIFSLDPPMACRQDCNFSLDPECPIYDTEITFAAEGQGPFTLDFEWECR